MILSALSTSLAACFKLLGINSYWGIANLLSQSKGDEGIEWTRFVNVGQANCVKAGTERVRTEKRCVIQQTALLQSLYIFVGVGNLEHMVRPWPISAIAKNADLKPSRRLFPANFTSPQ
jgi:hypothetical protein